MICTFAYSLIALFILKSKMNKYKDTFAYSLIALFILKSKMNKYKDKNRVPVLFGYKIQQVFKNQTT